MGGSDKRAKRAKAKAKGANIQRQRMRSKGQKFCGPSPKLIKFFEEMPFHLEERDCLERIYEYLSNEPEVELRDPEAAVMIIYAMYQKWNAQKLS
ncbi:TPA: hypothetical protein ACXIG9_004893 [Pseudomonas aeruginosa]